MERIRCILRRTARRLLLSRLIVKLHIVAIAVASVGLLLVLVDRLTAAVLPLTITGVALAALALLIAGVWAMIGRLGELQLAMLIDERLELDERISTALQCRGLDDSFARAAVEDGIAAASRPETDRLVAQRFPMALPRSAWVSPVVIIAALACTFLSPRDIFARKPGTDPEVTQRVREVRFEIQEQLDRIKETASGMESRFGMAEDAQGDAGDIDLPTGAEPIDQLRDQLREITDAQKRLEAMRDSTESKAMNQIEQQMRRLRVPGDGPASKMIQSLQRGDFAQAEQARRELAEKIRSGDMSAEDQAKLAEQMRKLAEQLQQMAQQQQQSLANALEQAGLDPAAASSMQALEQALKDAQNLTDEQKEQLRKLAEQNAKVQEMTQSMCDASTKMCQGMSMGNMGMTLEGLAGLGSQLGDLSELQSGCTLTEDMIKQLQQMAAACGSCQGGEEGLDQYIVATGMNPTEWSEIWKEELKYGKGMGNNPGHGAGGEAVKSETRTRLKRESLQTILGEGPMIARQLVQGTQVRGDSRAKFVEVLAEITEGLEDGLVEDRIPREYHEAIKRYFGDLQARLDDKAADDGAGDGGTDSGGTGENEAPADESDDAKPQAAP
ncbi:MAG: hypothetical protein KAS72_02910 [Phycisphaerales bacterium]|nr:hypothetical protein [Phycisphaerales bacterium]